jgi:hypothetical protein
MLLVSAHYSMEAEFLSLAMHLLVAFPIFVLPCSDEMG